MIFSVLVLNGYFASTFTYFVVYALHNEKAFAAQMNSMSAILQVNFSTFIAQLPVVKVGFKKPYITALGVVIVAVLGYVFTAFFGYHESVPLIIIITAVFGLVNRAVYYIPWSTYSRWPMLT